MAMPRWYRGSRAARRQREKRRRLDQRPVRGVHTIDLLDDGGAVGFAIKRFERLHQDRMVPIRYAQNPDVLFAVAT